MLDPLGRGGHVLNQRARDWQMLVCACVRAQAQVRMELLVCVEGGAQELARM